MNRDLAGMKSEALNRVESGADFCTAFMPDSENNELSEPIRLENEFIRAWRKSKTKLKVESWASPLSPTLSRGEREQVVGEFMSRTTAGEGAINCAKHDTNLSSYRLNVLSSNKKAAFTLAEILITLGVLGVVAAVTLPVVISQHNKRVVETRLAKFYAEVNQAISRAYVDNGEYSPMSKNDYQKNLTWVNNNLVPYMEIINIKGSGSSVMVTFKNGSMLRVLADGVVFYPLAAGKNDFMGKNCFAFSYVTNTIDSLNGRPYIANKKGITPYYGNLTMFRTKTQLYSHNEWGCRSSEKVACTQNVNKFCTAVIMQNGWKIPDDYPIRF